MSQNINAARHALIIGGLLLLLAFSAHAADAPITAVPMPAALDHSVMPVKIPKSKLPPRFKGWTVQRVYDTKGEGEQASQSDVGAFREPCLFARMAYDDPIVFPGQPGASHLHTFFGNANINAKTTTKTIRTGPSTCHGGTINRSAYWVPAMLDGATPVVPLSILVYYKNSYEFDISQLVQPVPVGLRMVSGNAKNTDPATTGARYSCLAPGANTTWYNTLAEAATDPICQTGFELVMAVGFPHCWDGVNLDSPNHASHLSGSEFVEVPGNPSANHRQCPATHPVVLPVISFNVGYTITDPQAVSRWRLASDPAGLPAGISGHGDYFMGWHAPTLKKAVDNCLRKNLDCHADLLGNGERLY